MKIIGLFTAWICEDWIEYSIKQALELVDELIISIGPFNNYFKKIEDATLEKAKEFFNNEKIKFIQTICDSNKNADENRCATLNRMLQASENFEIGNLIWILDVDEFYSNEAIKEIKNYINNHDDFDCIRFESRIFCINFNYYIKSGHDRIFKITTKQLHFTYNQQLSHKPFKIVILLKKDPLFHYSMLTGEQLRMIYWTSTDLFEQSLWYKKIYINYDPLNEEFWIKKNQELTGNYIFWFYREGIIENNGHGLFIYKGKHPELIENSPLRNILDFREFMKKKSNYKSYLEVIKELVADKKRDYFKKVIGKKIIKLKPYFNTFIKKTPFFRQVIKDIWDKTRNLMRKLL